MVLVCGNTTVGVQRGRLGLEGESGGRGLLHAKGLVKGFEKGIESWSLWQSSPCSGSIGSCSAECDVRSTAHEGKLASPDCGLCSGPMVMLFSCCFATDLT
jgi:hypothetical protein